MTDLSGASSAPFCEIAKAIPWADEDTNETIEAVKEHNAVGKKLCQWGEFGAGGFGSGDFGEETPPPMK